MVYQHLPDVNKTTKILASYLKPGGSLLVINRLADGKPLPENLVANMPAFEKLVVHVDGFKEADLRNMFENAGLVDFELKVLSKAREHVFPFPLFIAKGVKPKESS
ncbi:hypothetical protein ONZ45_g18316 [Pleurotus djamor]|nr:hypothetical protein ONZ45_g18316 [Pleurotus djamor]